MNKYDPMWYDPATGRVHDFIIYVDGESIKQRPTTERDARAHGWVLDDRPNAQQIRETLMDDFTKTSEAVRPGAVA